MRNYRGVQVSGRTDNARLLMNCVLPSLGQEFCTLKENIRQEKVNIMKPEKEALEIPYTKGGIILYVTFHF